MARSNLTRLRSLGIGLALVSLAFAACSKSSGTPSPVPSSSVTAVPTSSASPNGLSSPCASSLGIAYQPDGGNGGGFKGVQVTHFEDNAQNLCGATTTAPAGIAFASAVGPLAFSQDVSDAVALLQNPAGKYSLVQDIFGSAIGQLVPVGNTYDLSVFPTAAPTASGSPAASPTPPNALLVQDAGSIAILGGSNLGVALTTGLDATAIVALTSLINAPPQYGEAVPFSGTSYTLKSIPQNPRSIVSIGLDTSGTAVALARGPQDLLAFSITNEGASYQFDATAVDTTLGSNTALRGKGNIAFDPADSARALIGGTTAAGSSNVLTLVTGLPSAITKTSSLALPGAIQSIATISGGVYAIVGTTAGVVVVKGVNSTTLSIVPPFAPIGGSTQASSIAYQTCSGTTANLTNVASVGISSDLKYLVALGTSSGVVCSSGYNASIVAVPFNVATGTSPTPAPSVSPSPGVTASPLPKIFVQNNVIAPPAGADYLFVH